MPNIKWLIVFNFDLFCDERQQAKVYKSKIDYFLTWQLLIESVLPYVKEDKL